MSDHDVKESTAGSAGAGPAKPPRPPNPVWRMMGLPNFRLKLPSRNWMIFLAVTGSWSAAVYYDRREKKRIQRKWTRLVEHIAQEPLYEHQMPRKLTVYLSAPPADGLVPARDHFREYIQPLLVAAALDWDAIEGRREGDVRAGLAERIRRLRKKKGEQTEEPVEADQQEILEGTRERAGIKEWDGIAGDIVIGRHTWKEYVRGLHEGWLGPLDPPAQPGEISEIPIVSSTATQDGTAPSPQPSSDDVSPTTTPEAPPQEPEQLKQEENKPKKKTQPPPFNTPADYSNSILSSHCPPELAPSAAIPLPHLLGFWNFPIRIYRFLNRRQVADEIGRQTAAAVLAAYRPYDTLGGSSIGSTFSNSDEAGGPQWEQQRLLAREEPEWHKTARERKDDDKKERVWLDDMVLDSRIAERMRKFQLDSEVEERARLISVDSEKEPWWKSLWPRAEQKKAPWEDLD